jgi:hypothetical protein
MKRAVLMLLLIGVLAWVFLQIEMEAARKERGY